MNLDIIVSIAMWIIPAILLIKYVSKNKIREAFVIFSFKQLMTWLLGLSVAELHLIEYPVRLFPIATKASFTFEYFSYPAFCVVFNLNYPMDKSYLKQFLHYFKYCTLITIAEVFAEKYTDVLEYIQWNWFMTWISLCVTFYFSHLFYVWFYKLKSNKEQ